MSAICGACGARAELFICTRCTTALRENLAGLPRLLRHLDEARHGQTRLGESARRSSEHGSPMLANLAAAQLADQAHAILVEWTRDICEQRGVPTPENATGAALAAWLARNVSAIAGDQGAHVAVAEIRELCDDVERMINRPVAPREYGPCPGVLDTGATCRSWLYAPRHAREVHCEKCESIFDADTLIGAVLPLVDEFALTRELVVAAFAGLYGRIVSRSLWHQWRPHLTPASWRSPSGKRSLIRGANDEPEFLFGDVRRLAETRRASDARIKRADRVRCDANG